MNILCINHEFPPVGGGGATACAHIAAELVRAGHRVTVITCAFGEDPPTDPDGVRVLRVRCRRENPHSASFVEMASFLIAAFRRLPSVLRADGPFDHLLVFFGIPSGPVGWYCKKRWKIPYTVRLGGGDIPGTQDRFTAVYRVIAPFLRAIWRGADHVVANSEGLRLRAAAFYDGAQLAVICNGADVEVSDEPPARPQDDTLRMVSVARIVERKGIQFAVQALPEIVRRTEGRVHYTVVGDGPYRAEVEALAASLGVSGYLTVTGMVDRASVRPLLRESDVYLLPSLWEGMPNAVLEAMAEGLPVIMTSCEGSDELVDQNGMVVDLKGDIPAQIAQAATLLQQDPGLRARMGVSGRAMVLDRFSWARTAQAYVDMMR